MSDESKFALEQLLVAAEEMALEKNKENFVARKEFAAVLRRALGMEEEKVSAPAPIPQVWKPDFPQVRVKYSTSGEELDRKTLNTLEEFRLALQEEPMLVTWLPFPLTTRSS
jgi:hypothetical protein